MDDDEEYMAERNELLSRFRESLKKPLSERYFDEDELIDLFDDAGDLNDDYLRLEILAVAARFYPDSDYLNQRRCLLYGQLSDVAGKQMLANSESCTGPFWDIMRLRENPGLPSSQIEAALNDILESKPEMEDEEVVQLIRVAADLNQPSWLLKNQKRLNARCHNRRLVLLESAVAMETMQRYKDSAQMLTELVEIDPFSFSNWVMLAHQYLALGDDEQYEQAIDYALALRPDDWQALCVKGKYLLARDRAAEAVEVLRRAVKGADNSEPLRILAYALRATGRKEDSLKACRKVLRDFPADDYMVIPDMVLLAPTDIDDLLDRFYRSNRDNSELFWRSWAERMFEIGEVDAAVAIINCYTRQTGEPTASIIPAYLSMTTSKKPEETLQLLDTYQRMRAEVMEPIDYASLYVMRVLCLARLGRMVEAKAAIADFNAAPLDDVRPLQARLANGAVRNALRMISDQIDAGQAASFFWNFGV